MTEPLALLMHTAELATDLAHGQLHGLLREASGSCEASAGLGMAAVVQGRQLVLALEGPPELLAQAPARLARLPWLKGGQTLAHGPSDTRLFPGWRPRVAMVHPAFEDSVRAQLDQWRERPDAVNQQAVLRLLQSLAPETAG
jgi:hypothetical protein